MSAPAAAGGDAAARWTLVPFALLRGAGFPWHLVEACRLDPAAGAAALEEARRSLYRTLLHPRMAEAVHLCSPGMEARLRELDPARLAPRDSALRKQERRLYGYLQRFCCKNDTTGFFGPVDYATLDRDQARALRIELGPGRVAERRTLLSFWAAEAIARRIGESGLRDALCPVLAPAMRLLPAAVLDLGSGEETALAPEIVDLLRRADGATPLAALTAGCTPARRALLLRTFEALAQLGVLRTGIALAPTCDDPLALLQAFCRGAPASAERSWWLDQLDLLARRLQRFSQAGLDERRVLAAEMAAHVTRLGAPGERRGAGEFYADRTVFHEEARGNVRELRLGKPLLDKLSADLLPCLDLFAVRAQLTRQAWQRAVLGVLAAAYPGRHTLPFALAAACIARRADAIAPDLRQVAAFDRELAERFRARHCAGEAVLAPADLARMLQGWPRMRSFAMASPDILVEAADEAAIERGELRFILGEVHGGAQVWSGLLRFQSPREREALRAQFAQRLDRPGMPLVADLIAGRRVGRNFLHELPCLVVEYTGPSCGRTGSSVPVADLEVRLGDGELTLWSRSRQRQVELCRGTLTGPLADTFALEVQSFPVRFGWRTPRLCVGSMVLQRATWEMEAGFVRAALSDARFGDAPLRRMAHGCAKLGLPECFFVRSDAERKPVYIDGRNPFAADLFLSLLRAAQRITVSEVLPAPGRLWFAPGGAPHTCEFRLTACHAPVPA